MTLPNTLPVLSLHRVRILAIEPLLTLSACDSLPLGGWSGPQLKNPHFQPAREGLPNFSPCFSGPFSRKVGKTTAFLGFLPTFGL